MNFLKQRLKSLLSSTLPRSAKKGLLQLGIALAPDEFQEAAYQKCNAPNHEFCLRAIAKRGLSPQFAVDVGAYEGNWTRMAKNIWPDCHFTMIEPNIGKKAKLAEVVNETSSELVQELLGSEHGATVQFQVMETGSSVFPEQSDVPRVMEERQLTTLDHVLPHANIDLLKIDAQGYELEILRGATAVLPQVKMLILELSLIEINKGAPLLPEVLAFLSSKGFVIYDILEFHRRPLDNALWQIECIFVPESSPLVSDKKFH